MSSIVTNPDRIGRFTSSEVHKLVKTGRSANDAFSVAGYTYIEERFYERKRKRSLSNDAYSRSTAWGDIMEKYVFELLNLEYSMSSSDTVKHRYFGDFWSGSVDLIVPGVKVAEIKAYEAKKFCKYAECLMNLDLDVFKKDFAQEYWQIVSNACIHEVSKGEAILYQPYDSEAKKIAEFIDCYDGEDVFQYRYIYDDISDGYLYRLPFQPDDSGYSNLIVKEFEIPEEDKVFLTNRVFLAEKYLRENYK